MTRVHADAEGVSVPTCDAAPAVHVSNKSGFLIWTKNGRNPHVWHGTRERAEVEASRLAAKFPGQAFFVVAVTTKHKVCVVQEAAPVDMERAA